ncbi:hypothetical protein SPRG_15658 [Saprolegnia parasitica CBS 223.65]|uniref:Uncharacterized protein n=1 Tax=Saprolegnia parasitica (strain CBS 223.65) TaxID=695850 RepID=A0A067BR13_SAPPC|nr:hypothetical protein SPRG_15658 [Saprolegnia parasitica CBS 223.65]KDO19215.1 hypothetical protein SPRG_15658 [Saprolegnia parasitica CBS 223.65]|eukprot:XP_012210081.1 hypothetical protein SPRG_15658 [Saprolegnia parasitica CBS 223.65]
MTSTKRAAPASPSSLGKRPCSASTVLTNPSLIGAITDYSTNCLALCPTLYDIFDLSNVASCSFQEDEAAFNRLSGKHVTNGYVDHEEDLSKDELVARAKASVADPKALYRALEVHQKLAEIIAPITTTYSLPAGGIQQFALFGERPMLFAPSCRVDPTLTTWGRDDLVQIFNNNEIEFRDNGFGVPHGVGWHWSNVSDDGECAFCSAAGIVEENEELERDGGYGEEDNEIPDVWHAFIAAHGLHVNAFRSWRNYAYNALVANSEAHRSFCSNVIQPLQAHLRAHLSDVKIVTCDYRDGGGQIVSSSFVGGLTADGYLVGVFFGFEDVL